MGTEILEKELRKSCLLYKQTGDESHQQDIIELREMIRWRKQSLSRMLSKVLIGAIIATAAAPFIHWFLFYR